MAGSGGMGAGAGPPMGGAIAPPGPPGMVGSSGMLGVAGMPGVAGAFGGAGMGATAPAMPPPRSARFITADPGATRVALGADGKLPALVLADGPRTEEEEAEKKQASGPPWLLLLVFGFSITASVAMLLVESSGPQVERRSQTAARHAIRQYYTGASMPIAPYQMKLRLALQAAQRGDRETEKRMCREVLDILHSESKSKFTGITGIVDGPDPPEGRPSDRHLENLLSTLLND